MRSCSPALDQGGFEAIEVTEAGLREGIFFERLLGQRALFMDVRQESVENLAHRFETDHEHVHHVASLSLAMFDGLAAARLHELGAAERELLWAACILHDIGTAIDYDDHHRHSQYLILNAGLPGYSPRELVLIGLIALPPEGRARRLPARRSRRAGRCGAARRPLRRDQAGRAVRAEAATCSIRAVSIGTPTSGGADGVGSAGG